MGAEAGLRAARAWRLKAPSSSWRSSGLSPAPWPSTFTWKRSATSRALDWSPCSTSGQPPRVLPLPLNLARLAGELVTSEIESRARTSSPCLRRAWLKPRFSWVNTNFSPTCGSGKSRFKAVPLTTRRLGTSATVPPGNQERKGSTKKAPKTRPATRSRPNPQDKRRDMKTTKGAGTLVAGRSRACAAQRAGVRHQQ